MQSKNDLLIWAKKEFLNSLEITTYYQPIVNTQALETFGYEALSRFAIKGESLPVQGVLQMAEDMGLIAELDMLCRKKAIESFPKGKDFFLFLNTSPLYLTSEYFGKRKTLQLVKEASLKPEFIVFEIVETYRIQNIKLLKEAANYYRGLGFKIAIDDLGTGYNSLKMLLELEGYIDFVKLPREIVGGVSRSRIKYELVKVLTEVIINIGALPMYEGVEQEEDLRVLQENLGAYLFQGYYLAKPMPVEVLENFQLRKDLIRKIKEEFTEGEVPTFLLYSPQERFGKLLESLKGFKKRHLVLDLPGIGRYLTDLWSFIYRLSPQERNLYYYKSLEEVVLKLGLFKDFERIPKVSSEQLKAREVLNMLLSSEENFFIVDNHGQFYILEKHNLLNIFYKRLSKELLDKNPLTQLPGNEAIRRKIEDLSNLGKIFYVCYLDIDNFKAFNDAYGFYLGDQMIKRVGFLLKLFEDKEPNRRFVGHVGGDDFILLLWNEELDTIIQSLSQLLQELQKSLREFYKPEDIERGYFLGKDRDESIREFPVASISGVLISGSQDIVDTSKRCAQLKKRAKAHRGTALFVEDLNEILTIPV